MTQIASAKLLSRNRHGPAPTQICPARGHAASVPSLSGRDWCLTDGWRFQFAEPEAGGAAQKRAGDGACACAHAGEGPAGQTGGGGENREQRRAVRDCAENR